MTRSRGRTLVQRLVICVAGLVVSSTAASAHGFGHGGVGHGEAVVAVAVVLGLPTLAGIVGGVVAVRYRSNRGSKVTDRGSSVTLGLLLVGLGGASLVPAVTGHLWLSIAGGTVGATIALWVGSRWTWPAGCRNHAEIAGRRNHAGITLGAISTHRLFEGIVLGALYSAGAAVGLVGAVVIAAHTALETAAVGGLYATATRRASVAGAILLVQAGYVLGVATGLGVSDVVPVSIRTVALTVVGGALLAVGADETVRSVAVD